MDVSQTHWKYLPDQSYERSLGAVERLFYWAAMFARVADTIRCAEIKVIDGHLEEIIGPRNVLRSWLNVKQRFPLLGSRVYERDDNVFINVAEERLHTCQPDEISFCNVVSWQQAVELTDDLLRTDNQVLSNDLLSRVVVARDDGKTDTFYVLFTISHIITDGKANETIIQTFLDELCGVSVADRPSIEERLAMSVASEDLNPAARSNMARRRWQKAIAGVLASKLTQGTGGHGLPQKVSERTQFTPARSAHRSIALPPEISTRIIQNCRKQGITFGNAYPIISQVAAAHLLLRRYLRGEIEEAEWEFRKREPMYTSGPINLRGFLDQRWVYAGGMDHGCLAINFYVYCTTFLPLGSAAKLQPGMELPPVGELLTRDRFFHRSKLIQKQSKAFIGNPLFLDVANVAFKQRGFGEQARETGLRWRGDQGGPTMAISDRWLTPMERAGMVTCHGGSSIGNRDKRLPQEYPSTKRNESTAKVRLHLGQVLSRLRCRPAEVYLGAVTTQNQLTTFVHFDSNVTCVDIIDEWLEEIKMALEFYLGN